MAAVTVERLRDDDWQTLRDVRLAALEDSPHAFWARLADEKVYGRDKWISFLAAAAWFVARRGEEQIGVAAGMHGVTDPEPQLLGMWVAPQERGHGVGIELAGAVMDWARSAGAKSLTLWVTDGNAAALRMYQRLGFVPTGERAPMPHDAATGEIRMRAALSEENSKKGATDVDEGASGSSS
jgi:GNAT superfamily N-acetyltransferase